MSGPIGSTGSVGYLQQLAQEHTFTSSWPLARRTKCDVCGVYAEDHGVYDEPEEPDQLDKAEQTELEEKIKQLAQQAREKLEEQQ